MAEQTSSTTYPFGPDWSTVKPYTHSAQCVPKKTLPTDLKTTRRVMHPRPPSAFETGSLRYPSTYVPPPSSEFKSRLNVTVKFMGSGLDGKEIGVSVRSRGTVAELITTAVEALKHQTGAAVSYNNLRVTGLYSQAGRPLSAGHHLHSQGQVPQVKDGNVFVLKVLK